MASLAFFCIPSLPSEWFKVNVLFRGLTLDVLRTRDDLIADGHRVREDRFVNSMNDLHIYGSGHKNFLYQPV
jgi:hypothetical protein